MRLPVLIVALALAPAALAHAPLPPDEVHPLVDAGGVAFHGFAGMCHLDHETCPFPWDAEDNFIGPPCAASRDEEGAFVGCTGLWRDLWFSFAPGGGATFWLAGVPFGGSSGNDLIHVAGMRGTLAMSCDFTPTPPDAPACATNFAGSTVLVERWDDDGA